MTVGYINSIQSMGLMDGPGVRSVFFLQGCPISCLYCHNPDTQCFKGGDEYTVKEIVDFAKRYQNYYGNDGGVTFSGGEPLVQGEFLLECLKELKNEGIHTVIDTSGYGNQNYYRDILEYTDHVLLDIKAFNEDEYKEMVGASDFPLKYFMNLLWENDTIVTIRHVMVPGITDNKKSMDRLISYIDPILHQVDKIDILPFHQMGSDKYNELNLEYKLKDFPAMDRRRARGYDFYVNEVLKKRKAQDKMEYKTFTREERLIFTKNNALFESLDENSLDELVDHIDYRVMDRGEKIFQSFDKADKFFIIVSGKIKIFEYTLSGNEQILYIYTGGEFIGGHNMLTDTSYQYNGECIVPGVIGIINKEFFNEYLKANANVLMSLLQMSFRRIRLAESLIQRLTAGSTEEKVASLLLQLIPTFGKISKDTVYLDLSMTRSELASMVGVTRETLTRKLLEYQDKDLIKIEGNKKIIIKDMDGLREAAQVVLEVPD